ncbi:hypothetical protein [Adhaeribacter rhizoryzae]|uniref:Uncharacterized protein n=1 Tax=Adhaeribacter rhizoryzae TaxID=2607907 RepID=A0A5M6DKV3_9BACT|nr:hypothetical protein [Adhaeribacter rhizoryzae]KAA5546800.1 hypothetical protein F0145_10735 [Adhaeribacter rhizoryzae]
MHLRYLYFLSWLGLLVLTSFKPARAQHEGFIYGRVQTQSGEVYTGQIRWSAQQVFWGDILLGVKTEVPVLQYLNEEQISQLSPAEPDAGFDWQFINLWKSKYPARDYDLKLRFGDVAALQITGAQMATLLLKNNRRIKIAGHPDDNRHLGKDITVYDNQIGRLTVNWDNLKSVNFLPTPAKLPHVKGIPLYGTVQTQNGPLTGFIKWDQDEYVSSHQLDGQLDSNPQNFRYPFSQIHSIQVRDRGVIVKFYSDDKIFLKNNRDVNASNRGIVVQHPTWGQAIVSWEAFRSVTFEDKVPANLGYESYGKPQKLRGTIRTTDNQNLKGELVFDLDEEWSAELLDGRFGNSIRYTIPFGQIISLKPVPNGRSEIIMADEKKLTLENENDVSGRNWGLMLLLPNKQHRYIPWAKVSQISFF